MLFRADPWLHVIAGCMSSGKTDELLRLLRRAEIAKRRILLVRPDVDDRTPAEYAESRSKARYPSTPGQLAAHRRPRLGTVRSAAERNIEIPLAVAHRSIDELVVIAGHTPAIRNGLV